MSNGLGRGLNSLIPQKINKKENDYPDVSSKEDKDKVLRLSLDKISVNPMQPRRRFSDNRLDELVESVKLYGIIQPLIVSERDGGYELIAGERRLRAAEIVGLKEVPAIVRGVSEVEKLEVALVENLQREDLNPVETAMAYRRLIDEFNLSQEEVAERTGKSRSAVSNTLRVLNLPEDIKIALIDGKITEGHAKILSGLDGPDRQMVLFRKMLNAKMSVGDAAREARHMGGTKQARVKINYADKDKEFAFREFFKSKAEIRRKGKGGQIIINFYSDEELEGMVDKIKN